MLEIVHVNDGVNIESAVTTTQKEAEMYGIRFTRESIEKEIKGLLKLGLCSEDRIVLSMPRSLLTFSRALEIAFGGNTPVFGKGKYLLDCADAANPRVIPQLRMIKAPKYGRNRCSADGTPIDRCGLYPDMVQEVQAEAFGRDADFYANQYPGYEFLEATPQEIVSAILRSAIVERSGKIIPCMDDEFLYCRSAEAGKKMLPESVPFDRGIIRFTQRTNGDEKSDRLSMRMREGRLLIGRCGSGERGEYVMVATLGGKI